MSDGTVISLKSEVEVFHLYCYTTEDNRYLEEIRVMPSNSPSHAQVMHRNPVNLGF